MSKKIPSKLDGEKAHDVSELITLTFNKQSKLYPSNVNELKEQWDAVLRTEYRLEGAFIKEGSYRTAEIIPAPDLTGIDAGSLAYKAAETTYMEEVKHASKKKRQISEKRIEMYCKMYNAVGTTARAEIATDPSFEKMHEANNDPLALWKLIVKKCSSSGVDQAAAKMNELKAYTNFYQGKDVSLVDYHRGAQAKIELLQTIGGYVPSDAEQASHFVHGLDKARYVSFIDNIDGGVMKTPDTLADAYSVAAKHVVRVSNIKAVGHHALVSQSSTKESKESPKIEDGKR